MTIPDLWKTLRRHIGHTLRCVRLTTAAAGVTVETVCIRCEDCGEVVVEAAEAEPTRHKGQRARPV